MCVLHASKIVIFVHQVFNIDIHCELHAPLVMVPASMMLTVRVKLLPRTPDTMTLKNNLTVIAAFIINWAEHLPISLPLGVRGLSGIFSQVK